MAACKSLQHIFEAPLPENPTTLLETRSPWSQIMTVKPSELHSSFTDIFGELHFKESYTPTSATDSNPWKEPISNDETSNLLQLCTEGLGYESLDDIEDLKGGMDKQEWQRDEEKELKQIQHPNSKAEMMIKRTKCASMDDFPPPISCIGKSGKPWVGFKSYRYGGRFILKEIRVTPHEVLHASRENGRLKLHILVPNDQEEK